MELTDDPKRRITVDLPESWILELDAAAKKRFTSRHSFILQAIRRVLDTERGTVAAARSIVPQAITAKERRKQDCDHPITRRIGKGCGVCGAEKV